MKYKKNLSIVLLCFVLSIVAASGQDTETTVVETNLVSINVAVRDAKGLFVRNLRKEQFEVFDNGAKQEIALFSAEKAPVTYGIVYDMHPTTDERTAAVLESLRAFTKNLSEEDRFFVMAFNHYGSLNLDFVPTVEQIEKNLTFELIKSSYSS